MEQLTDQQLDALFYLHDKASDQRRKADHISENDQRSLERWFGKEKNG
jgi:hypothetical protein